VSEAFAEAKMPYRAASDAPLAYIRFQSAWDYEAAGEKKSILVAGLYLETLSQGKYVFVLPDSPDLPRRAVLVKGDFLSAILTSHERLPGAEALAPSPPEKIQSAFSSALLAGFALYGVPLTDEMPYAAEGGLTRAQRFARGWIIAD
jgi:hypothetical protein